jgi:tRNA-dihydrouridine synthase
MKHHEDNESKALWTWVQYIPELRDNLFHVPNGGKRNAREAGRMKAQGVRAGVHDYMLPVARGRMHGLWIEFKAARPNNARYQANQKEWADKMRSQGYAAFCCCGVDEARKVFEWYLALPKPDVVEIPDIRAIIK